MNRKRNRNGSVQTLEDIRCATTQRVIDSMPAAIDEIKAERERKAWKLRKEISEQENQQ